MLNKKTVETLKKGRSYYGGFAGKFAGKQITSQEKKKFKKQEIFGLMKKISNLWQVSKRLIKKERICNTRKIKEEIICRVTEPKKKISR